MTSPASRFPAQYCGRSGAGVLPRLSFYAHGHPKEKCQQELTGARRASRGKSIPCSIAQDRTDEVAACAACARRANYFRDGKQERRSRKWK